MAAEIIRGTDLVSLSDSRDLVSTRVVRWMARAWAVATVILVVLFIVGERSYPASPVEWLGFAFFPTGVCAGIVLAWWREGVGGIIAVGSLVAFYVVHLATVGTFPSGLAWLAFAGPGFLFLFCWCRSRGHRARLG